MTPQLTPAAIALIERQLARMGGLGGLDAPFFKLKKEYFSTEHRDAGENPPTPRIQSISFSVKALQQKSNPLLTPHERH